MTPQLAVSQLSSVSHAASAAHTQMVEGAPITAGGRSDAAHARDFDTAMHMAKVGQEAPTLPAAKGAESNPHSLGDRLIAGVKDVSSRFNADQRYISSIVEQAATTGNDALMMRALLALGDYQNRVQIMSKTVSKAASSIDQLTRLN